MSEALAKRAYFYHKHPMEVPSNVAGKMRAAPERSFSFKYRRAKKLTLIPKQNLPKIPSQLKRR